MLMYSKYIKRIMDILISIFGLLIFLPLLLITAVCIKIESRGPLIFRQKRIGKDGKVFEILKFRSMYMDSEKKGSGVYSYKNDSRVTKVGKIIRALSIDELPQFINILRGEMSLVGFRPPLTYHPWLFEKYTEEQKKMFRVKPGVTGWAQVNGRKNVEWSRRIELNIWYAEHLSFLLDVKIVLMTVLKVLSNSDNVAKHETVQHKESDTGINVSANREESAVSR